MSLHSAERVQSGIDFVVSKYADGFGNGWGLVVQNGHWRGFYQSGHG